MADLQALYQSKSLMCVGSFGGHKESENMVDVTDNKANLCAPGATFWSSQTLDKWTVLEVLMYSDH